VIIHNEKEVRSIVKKAIVEASKREGGGAEFGSFGGVKVDLGLNRSKKKGQEKTDIDPTDVDVSLLDSKTSPERIIYLAKETGLPPDFIYGIESKESNHKPGVMAWNTHHYRRHSGDKSFYPNKKSVYGSEARRMYKEAAAKNLSAAIKAGAWGLYQVLGSWSLPRYGNDPQKWMSKWKSDPAGHAADAFIDWAREYQKSVNWIDLVNKGNAEDTIGSSHPYARATKFYYGALKTSYYTHVIEKARQWNNSVSKSTTVTSSGDVTKSNTKGGKDSWKGRLGTETRRGINFHKILDNKNNYRAGIKKKHTDPTVEFWKELREEYGIKNVVALTGDATGKIAANNAEKAGLNVFRNFINENNMGGRANFNKAKEMLKSGNTLVYCTHGADRTGAYIGRYYIEELGYDFQKALSDTKKYGGHKPDKPGANYKSARDFLQFGPGGAITEQSDFDFGAFGGVGFSSTGSTSKSSSTATNFSSDKVDRGVLNVKPGSVALIGDSQVGNGLGKWIKNRFSVGNERVCMLVGGHAGTVVNQSNFSSSVKDAELVILTLGGHPSNKKSNCMSILNKIYELAPNASIVWIGGPPAFEPKSSNSMVSKKESSDKYWLAKRDSRCERNEKVIRPVVKAHTKQPTYFINPCKDLTVDNYKPSSGDGIHVPSGHGNFLSKYLGGSTPMIS